jgi:hypothetical protein
MKLSVEAKAAVGIAAAFAALTLGAIAQGHHGGQTDGHNGYGLTNNSGLNHPRSQNEYNGSQSDRINAAENAEKFYGEDETVTTPQKPPSSLIDVIRL